MDSRERSRLRKLSRILPALRFPLSAVSFTYDLQGRMYQATTETFNAGTLASRIRATHQYGTDGIRYRAISESDTVLSLNAENWQLTSDTKYLIDTQNHTGYSHVLEEAVTDGNGDLVKKIVYSIGLDHISQTTFTPSGPAQGVTAVFHHDGHGSTRVLTDLAGSILMLGGLGQVYHFDAYGNALNFNMSAAATQYLYSGEQFDARVDMQILGQRYYNQANGTFNRLDPFFGNQTDPQSFHKYLYTHADPVTGVDPTGLLFGTPGFGYRVEAVVENQYEYEFPNSFPRTTFGKWARLGPVFNPLGTYIAKPDILDHDRKRYLEIKPFSISGLIAAESQMIVRAGQFLPFKYFPDVFWMSVPRSTNVDGIHLYLFNVQGVIFYTDWTDIQTDLIAIVGALTIKELSSLFIVHASRFGARAAFAAIPGLVGTSTGIDSARMNNSIGIAIILAMMGG